MIKRTVLLSFGLLLVAGCGDEKKDPGSFTVTVSPADIEITEGSSVDVTVTLTRDGYNNAVEIELDELGLIEAVDAAPLTINPGENAGTLSISAPAGATQGDRIVNVRGIAGPRKSEAGMKILVRGLPGTLDQTFGTNGYVTTDFGYENDVVLDLAVQSDGRIVAAGTARNAGQSFFGLARYHMNGDLDATFGAGTGLVMADISGGQDAANAIHIDANGRMLVAGYSSIRGGDMALTRFSPDGSIDMSFAGGFGVTLADFQGTYQEANDIAISSTGDIVLGGDANVPASGPDFIVSRFDSNGILDLSFGGAIQAGWSSVDIAGNEDGASTVLMRANDAILLAGSGVVPVTNLDMAFVGLDAAGAVDTTYGTGGTGVETAMVSNLGDSAADAVWQADGKLVTVGTAQNDDIQVSRFEADGTFDTTFGGGAGYVVLDYFGNPDTARALAIQPDGKIVLVGRANTTSGNDDIAVVRLEADGTLDATFGGTGKVTLDLNTTNDRQAFAISIQTNGRILVAGDSDAGTDRDFIVARYWD